MILCEYHVGGSSRLVGVRGLLDELNRRQNTYVPLATFELPLSCYCELQSTGVTLPPLSAVQDTQTDRAWLDDMYDEEYAGQRETTRAKNKCIISMSIAVLTLATMWVPDSPVKRVGVGGMSFVNVHLLGASFHMTAFKNARHASLDMSTLVSLSSLLSFWMSVIMVVTGGGSDGLYFDTGSVLVGFVLLGFYVEDRVKAAGFAQVSGLGHADPCGSVRLLHRGIELRVPDSMLELGDTVEILPGEKVPVDGHSLSEKTSFVNEAQLTGESNDVVKTLDSPVFSGSVVVGHVPLVLRVDAIGSRTCVGTLFELMNREQLSGLGYLRTADRISAIFVPSILILSLSVFTWWFCWGIREWGSVQHAARFALRFSIAVLAVACPCAFGLATPTAVAAAFYAASKRRGIFIKSGRCLEIGADLTCVALDKTGTLTEGRPSVVDYVSEVQDFWYLVGSAEQRSQHPIGEALAGHGSLKARMDLGRALSTDVKGFEHLPHGGVQCWVDSTRVRISSARDLPEIYSDWIAQQEGVGCTVVAVLTNNEHWSVISLRDTIKPDAQEHVHLIQKRYQVLMCTGDSRAVANYTGMYLGIPKEQIVYEARPDEKLDAIRSLQHRGHKVLMMGDGLNDAPALAAADLGVALGAGPYLSRSTADVVLSGTNIADLTYFLQLCRSTRAIILQNFAWAVLFNLITVSLATGAFYPHTSISPNAAGALMACSSIAVVLNSLRIRRM